MKPTVKQKTFDVKIQESWDFLTLEDGTNGLTRNDSKELPLYAVWFPEELRSESNYRCTYRPDKASVLAVKEEEDRNIRDETFKVE